MAYKVIMVKKQLKNGSFCEKCVQIEELLKKRGYWDGIDEVVIAKEDDSSSEGMRLAAEYGVRVAPFFIVRGGDDEKRVYTSGLKLINSVFRKEETDKNVKPGELRVDLNQMETSVAGKSPRDVVEYALSLFGADCTIAFSGAEDVVLIDMAADTGLPFSVFSLDTGRLHPETYRFIGSVRDHYGITVRLLSPDSDRLEPFVEEKGLFSFYQDGHKECCGIRKVEPLQRALAFRRAWITGQRKDQNPSTRGDVAPVQEDPSFSGLGGDRLIKFNPLANWSLKDVWGYIRKRGVPYNTLHDRGFVSIGCEPCTRAVLPGEHERAGRWWWEEETKRECGLHVSE